jgi:hypothetical protein
MTLTDGLRRDIKVIEKDLKDEAQLKKILKLRLTKKEYKTLLAINEGQSDEYMKEKLSLDDERLQDIKDTIIRKLNYEKLKYELYEV